MTKQSNILISQAEVARRAGLSRPRVHELGRLGRLPTAVIVGGRQFYWAKDIRKWVAARRTRKAEFDRRMAQIYAARVPAEGTP